MISRFDVKYSNVTVLCLTNSDIENIYITLNVKSLSKTIKVIARATDESMKKKFELVITSYSIHYTKLYEENLLDGLWQLIKELRAVYPYESHGYNFLMGTPPQKIASSGTFKRYLMFLRWMVRKDTLDMGLWTKIDKKDLLMPLDRNNFV